MKPPAQASWLFSHTLKRKQWKQRNRRIVSYLLGLFCRTLNSARKPYFGRKQQIGGILALYFSTMAMWKNALKRIIIQMACYCRSLRFRWLLLYAEMWGKWEFCITQNFLTSEDFSSDLRPSIHCALFFRKHSSDWFTTHSQKSARKKS